MKTFIFTPSGRAFGSLLLAVLLSALTACSTPPSTHAATTENLWFVFLERGRPTPDDKAAVAEMQRGHLDNFKRLFAEKKLFAAGPLQDPGGSKRGIVVVTARTMAELTSYFAPDEYVREGFMTLNAAPALAHTALATEGIDPSGIEEVRIIQVLRTNAALGGSSKADDAYLQALVDKGVVSAWYRLRNGPIREVLFSRSTDSKMLQDAFLDFPPVKSGEASVVVWRQWLAKGVVK